MPVVVRGDGVAIRRSRGQFVEARVIREYGLSIDAVRVGALDGVDHGGRRAMALQKDPGIGRLRGRGPGHEHCPGRIVAPGQMDLLRRSIRRCRGRLASQGKGGGRRRGPFEEITSGYRVLVRSFEVCQRAVSNKRRRRMLQVPEDT